jgi:hypothetical protein
MRLVACPSDFAQSEITGLGAWSYSNDCGDIGAVKRGRARETCEFLVV